MNQHLVERLDGSLRPNVLGGKILAEIFGQTEVQITH
jgi:hypothetical protein